MEIIPFANTGRQTTRLGFGGSGIMGALDRRQSLSMLRAAYDAGVRHFDTAPMYGYGEAESCLGEFLREVRGQVTITTKFGIPPPDSNAVTRLARVVARPVLQSFPGLKQVLRKTVIPIPGTSLSPVTPSEPNPIFTARQARESLEASLATLGTDHIDLWLLHEVTAQDLTARDGNHELLRVMEDAVRDGKIGAFGAGSHRDQIPELVRTQPDFCRVAQFEWSVFDPAIPDTPYPRIHHRALSQHLPLLVAWLQASPATCLRWSIEVGADLANARVLAQLMLKAALVMNPASVVLFSSKRPEHILANIDAAEDTTLDQPARRLHALFQRERPPIPALGA